jgi:hypothetical protein
VEKLEMPYVYRETRDSGEMANMCRETRDPEKDG